MWQIYQFIMDKGGGFNYLISSSWRTILGVSLIIFLPLLLYPNSAVWNLRKPNETLSTEKVENKTTPEIASSSARNHSVKDVPTTHTAIENKLLDGLLPVGFDEQSCISRYESHLYHKPSPHKPSSPLLSKLRNYERLHRHCGPKSRQYNSTLRNNTIDCNYIVWFPVNGLGNRMLSLASTFLYALLTNRVLLVAFEEDMLGVFCEPFLNSTWNLPHDFPHRYQIDDLPTYANFIKNGSGSQNNSKVANLTDFPPLFLFVNLQHERSESEGFFHCGEEQRILKTVPFLIMRSDQYFVPSLFMIPSFKEELNEMFPEKDTVFHHLGRYLFSPSDEAWRQITRFYTDNLSKADKKVGIQVRVFAPKYTLAKTITEQILACTLNNSILPKVYPMKNASKNKPQKKAKAVLVTSLYKEYSENLREIYKTGQTETGEVVQVYQPSHEEVQRLYNNTHNVKALTEMYLLSVCDELVTSGWSTFGYVGQGLGAMKPWIMYKHVGNKFRDPPCQKDLSMEPCFHYPSKYDCQRRIEVEHISSVFPHMRRCVDKRRGVKMVSQA